MKPKGVPFWVLMSLLGLFFLAFVLAIALFSRSEPTFAVGDTLRWGESKSISEVIEVRPAIFIDADRLPPITRGWRYALRTGATTIFMDGNRSFLVSWHKTEQTGL